MEWSFDITTGLRERMRRIYLFEPLHELAAKQQKDDDGQDIDMRMLGLLTLLYFFEMKLMRESRVGIEEAANYLRPLIQKRYNVADERVHTLLLAVKEIFRPAKGLYKTYSFYNWETEKVEEIPFSFLKTDFFDVKENRQYYQLDDDGLELIFATKEYFQEFQLSIHQLMLRKLLEKGELQGALRQINEMRMDVEQLHERMEKLSHEIKRNIINMETQQRFMEVLQDRNLRLQRENTEFEELHKFIVDAKKASESTTNEEDMRAFRMLMKIEEALMAVHEQHRALLTHSLKLKQEALEAAEQSLYSIGVDNFNFDQEIVSEIVSTPLPLESMKGILAPFLKVGHKKMWSLLTIFSAQSWSEEEQSAELARYEEIVEEEKREQYAKQIRTLYGAYMKSMLAFAEGHQSWTVQDWLEHIKEQNDFSLDARYLYDFLLLCHHRSPLYKDSNNADEQSLHLLIEVTSLLGDRQLVIEELPNILQPTKRYSIQNLQFKWQEG